MKITNSNKSKLKQEISNINNIKGHERFYFQNLKGLKSYNPCIELKGTLNIKINNNNIKKEEITYSKISLKKFPDSKRTLIPFYQENHDQNKRTESYSSSFTNPNFKKSNIIDSNQDLYIPKSKYQYKKMTTEIYDIQENRKYIKPKLIKKYNNFSKYNFSSQIYSLPGKIKRESTEIHDDDLTYKYQKIFNLKDSIKYKINGIYKSDIFKENSYDCVNKSYTDKRNIKSSINIFKNDNINKSFNQPKKENNHLNN